MRKFIERAEPALRILCLVLAGLVLYQLAGVVIRWNPFRGVTVPPLPSLASATNSPAGGGRGTNLIASTTVKGTNSTQRSMGSNAAPSIAIANTNSPPMPAGKETNSTVHAGSEMTNATAGTNVVANLESKSVSTNSAAATAPVDKGTNPSMATNAPGTNVFSKPEVKIARGSSGPAMAGMNFNSFPPAGKQGDDLPPAMRARISRITESEILGPVMRPLPMGLLGVAGEFAFLRSASGQTGLVKEGDSLGDIKLLRIGINRVLIEQDGQKKELMIFSGYGGESLLQTNTPNENNHP